MIDSRKIWQDVYNKDFPFKNYGRLSKMLCFFGSHKMMPLDEMADLIECEYCGRKERFYRGHGYEKIQGEES